MGQNSATSRLKGWVKSRLKYGSANGANIRDKGVDDSSRLCRESA